MPRVRSRLQPLAGDQAEPARWLDCIGRVLARVTSNADREGVLTALANGLHDEFGVVTACIWLYDPADDALHLRAFAGLDGAPPWEITRVAMHDLHPVLAQAAARREPVVIDLLDPASPFEVSNVTRGQGLRAYAGMPLLVGDRLCGGIELFAREPWPPALLQALTILAQQAALTLDHARLFEESQALQSIAAQLASTKEVQALLDAIVERAHAAFGADGCAVWLIDAEGALQPAASVGMSTDTLERLAVAPSEMAHSLFQEIRRTGHPLATTDDQSVRRPRTTSVGRALAGSLAAEGVVSALRLPLPEPGGAITGMLALYHRHERIYSDSETHLAQAFANHIAVALHNTRLAEQERAAREEAARLAEQERAAREIAARQLDRLTTLTRITQQLLAATELDAVLSVVVKSASRLCDASGAMVGLIDDPRQHMMAVAAHGEPRAYFEGFVPPTLDEAFLTRTATGRALTGREAVAVEDYARWSTTHELQAMTVALGVRAFVVAPLLVDGLPIGVLWVNDTRPRPFATRDVALVQALADQAALAIEHARLLQRSREAAALEERARLARDLHDSVTQSVFSVSMMANAAQAQYERRTAALGGTLARIKTVAQDALSEMRALLYELHPTALAEEGLAKALPKLVAAVQVRVDIPISYTGTTGARLSAETEVAIFRIVQEALANAAKYAQATAIGVTLAEDSGWMTMTVADDGVGFDPAAPVAPSSDGGRGGMGLRSMRERAAATGLTLRVASAPGAGTRITVEAPVP